MLRTEKATLCDGLGKSTQGLMLVAKDANTAEKLRAAVEEGRAVRWVGVVSPVGAGARHEAKWSNLLFFLPLSVDVACSSPSSLYLRGFFALAGT